MRFRRYIIFFYLIGGILGTKTLYAQSPEDTCQFAQDQLRYYFMEYNPDGYLNRKYLEDLYYSCDSVSVNSSISYYFLRASALLEVRDNYIAKPNPLFYYYYKKFQDFSAQARLLRASDPEFLSMTDLRADQLQAQVKRAESLGDQPYLREDLNGQAASGYPNTGSPQRAGPSRGDIDKTPSNSIPDFMAFPYPVANYSDTYPLGQDITTGANTLGDINQRITHALHAQGYYGKRYFPLPEGFALVTQLEKSLPDGGSLPTLERWKSSVINSPRFSLREYLMSLVFAEKGHYQVFAFVVMPTRIAENPRLGQGRLDPKPWQEIEGEKLPEKVAQLGIQDSYRVEVYLFSFDASGRSENAQLRSRAQGQPLGSMAEEHLHKANLLQHLTHP